MGRRRISVAIAALGLAVCAQSAGSGVGSGSAGPSPGSSNVLLIRHVHVVPMTRDTVLRDHSVRIVGDTIDRIAPAGELVAGEGDVVVEGQGRYLMPGLVDFHVQLRDESELLS